MLTYTIYKSRALIARDSEEHDRILSACRRRNGRDDISGFLHREEDIFIQYLEGPPDKIASTLARIKSDPRHRDVEVLDTGDLKKRHLPDWQMGFVDGDQLSVSEIMGVDAQGMPDFSSISPFDLVVFMVSNSQCLSETAKAA